MSDYVLPVAYPYFGRYVKPLVPAAFAVVIVTYPHGDGAVSYFPLLLNIYSTTILKIKYNN
jgi:hypothetical protein